MRKDIKILLKYLQDFLDKFQHISMNLYSNEEDSEMIEEITRIRRKYNF